MKRCLFIILMFCDIAAKAQCTYPDAKSATEKPAWLTKELPPNTKTYYYDMGYGKGETREEALANAIAHIGKKRDLATGQIVSFGGTEQQQSAEGGGKIVVKARIEHEYWERCLDPELRKNFYHLNILCLVAAHPDNDISKVVIKKKYLSPAR